MNCTLTNKLENADNTRINKQLSGILHTEASMSESVSSRLPALAFYTRLLLV